MRTRERLLGLRAWIEKNLCEGREMKAPASNMDITKIVRKKPECYIGFSPTRMDPYGNVKEDPDNVVPGIIVMPSQAYAKYTEEKRFDRYNNIMRSQELGQHLSVSILFSVYEPGTRYPGFIDSGDENGKGLDMSLISEGSEEGFFTLMDWIDDCNAALLRDKQIPNTDLFVEEQTMTYSLYTDQSYVVDRRPIYYGFVNVSFACYASHGENKEINALL